MLLIALLFASGKVHRRDHDIDALGHEPWTDCVALGHFKNLTEAPVILRPHGFSGWTVNADECRPTFADPAFERAINRPDRSAKTLARIDCPQYIGDFTAMAYAVGVGASEVVRPEESLTSTWSQILSISRVSNRLGHHRRVDNHARR